jgi:hypothetical protein
MAKPINKFIAVVPIQTKDGLAHKFFISDIHDPRLWNRIEALSKLRRGEQGNYSRLKILQELFNAWVEQNPHKKAEIFEASDNLWGQIEALKEKTRIMGMRKVTNQGILNYLWGEWEKVFPIDAAKIKQSLNGKGK